MSKQSKIAARRRLTEPYPRLDDVLNRKNLDRHLAAGTVRAATHDSLGLWVYSYTSLCEARRCWDGVTTVARGLVRDNKGRVIARGFEKFFAHGQKGTSAIRAVRWTDDWFAAEKVDGTMVLASNFEGRLLLSTKRSFDAWQLDRARGLWPSGLLPEPGETWVLEFTAPENRIVVSYDRSELWLLGVVDNWSGEDLVERERWVARSGAFRLPELFEAADVPALLRSRADDGTCEGFVVVWPRSGRPSGRLKVKYPSWIAAHEELFGRSSRSPSVASRNDGG